VTNRDSCAGDAKNAHLAALGAAAGERLRLFRADVLDYGAVAAAVAGCDGVFHVASPVPVHAITDPEAPHHLTLLPFLGVAMPSFRPHPTPTPCCCLLQVELLAPAVTGTANVLRACSEAKVRRVVVVSSLSAVMVNPAWPQSQAMDEACWSDVELCRSTQVTEKKKASHPVSLEQIR
jgi:nucleoside-diphosphate-sugar epimerase